MVSATDCIDFLLSPLFLRVSLALILGLALCTDWGTKNANYSRWQSWTRNAKNYSLPIAVPAVLGWIWLTLVNKFVPEPYMDEIFHIPQAQVYCQGKWTHWDDKITTPPGLYVFSIIWARISDYRDCSAHTLRQFNLFATVCTALVAGVARAAMEGLSTNKTRSVDTVYARHTGTNIALFPVLFFFSGLYYTDIISTCVVLVAYLNHQVRMKQGRQGASLLRDLYAIILGVVALFMRQTNVFWVVVYMGGLEAFQAIKDNSVTTETPSLNTWINQANFFVQKSSAGAIHDPPLQEAWPEDIVLCILSIAIAGIFNVKPIVRRIYPQLIIVALFAAFVAWNGAVVLGDKTNHIATLHLAQMLYIWPLFGFFSAPLYLPQALRLLGAMQSYVAHWKPSTPDQSQAKTRTLTKMKSGVNYLGILLSVLLVLGSLLIAGLIIRYNTIIHPFTLADNRHYMFYVFRYSIMKGPVVRLLLAPVYVFFAVLAWTALYPTPLGNSAGPPVHTGGSPSPPVLTSQVLVLLLTITLNLMSAPLVEPRYFILPWIFWRLLVPRRTGGTRNTWDWTLLLESAWFMLINAALMYIFLTRPFIWKTEDGTVLDGGKVQRFMW